MPEMPEGEMPEQDPAADQEGMPGEDADASPGPEAEQPDQAAPDAAPGAESPQPDQVPTEVPTVQLSELADIEVDHKAESISRTNGEEAIGIQIIKTADANTVDVVNKDRKSVE